MLKVSAPYAGRELGWRAWCLCGLVLTRSLLRKGEGKLRVGVWCVRRVAARMKGAYIFWIGDGARRVAQST